MADARMADAREGGGDRGERAVGRSDAARNRSTGAGSKLLRGLGSVTRSRSAVSRHFPLRDADDSGDEMEMRPASANRLGSAVNRSRGAPAGGRRSSGLDEGHSLLGGSAGGGSRGRQSGSGRSGAEMEALD